jgi:Flp pilus assembly protein TadD
MFAIVLAYIVHLTRDEQKQLSLPLSRALVASVVLISLFGLYTAGMSYINARGIIHGLSSIRSGNLPRAQEAFVRVIERGGPGKQEAVEQFGLSIDPETFKAFQPADVEAYVTRALEEADRFVEFEPLNPRTALFRAVVYTRTGQYEKARTAFEEAIVLQPNKQSALLGYAEVLLALGEDEEALALTEKMYTENPHFERLKIAYVITLFQSGQDEKALALLDEEEIIDPNLARILYERGHYKYVAEILDELSKKDPDNPQLRTSLAAAYYHAGNKGLALQVMQQVIKDFPSLREQAEQIMNQIISNTLPRELGQ